MWIQDNWRRFEEAVRQLGWEERLIIGVVVLAILITIAIYAIRRFRQGLQQPIASYSDHLTDFRRMRDAGKLDDKEFSRVVDSVSRHGLQANGSPVANPPAQSENVTSPTQGG